MTLLNALLYLVLLLAGTAAGLVLMDLNQAEKSALQALAHLEAESQSVRPAPRLAVQTDRRLLAAAMPMTAKTSMRPLCPERSIRPDGSGATLRPIITPAGFVLILTDRTDAGTVAPATALNFDFALAATPQSMSQTNAPQKSGQAASSLPATDDSRRWDCCA